MCYLTIWNSPADVTGTATVDDGGKKDNKGTFLYPHLRYIVLLRNI